MPPGGAKLLYSAAAGWACVCAPGFAGASCTTTTTTTPAAAATPSSSCPPPPPCEAPSGSGRYRFDNSTGAFLVSCVCAAGYAGAPCALVAAGAAPVAAG
jgi:hypothetical protein